jgi:two-component system sensor histidine kinase BaeS
MRTSLQTRLLVAVGLVAITAVVIVALAARQGTRREFLRFQELERKTSADRAPNDAARVARQMDGRCCAPGVLREVEGGLGPDQILIVLDGQGRAVGSAGPGLRKVAGLDARAEPGVLAIDAARRRGDSVERLSLRFREPGAPLRLSDGRTAIAHLIDLPPDRPDEPAARFLGSVDRRLLWVTTLVAIAAIVATWLVARGTVRPLVSLRDATLDLAGGNLARRVTPSGAQEVEALGRAFNAMAVELEHQLDLRRRLVNDVAHELRTPITAMRCRLETLVDGLSADPARSLSDLTEDVRHLARLVDDLQEVALAEARELRLSVSEVALADVARSAARAAGLERDPRLAIGVAETASVRADPVRVRQMLLNLLSNAERHTPAGGTIEVRSDTGDGRVLIEVLNTGPRLDEATITRLFDRFYRTDEARERSLGGAGLGLAIVKHLAEAQGGGAWARSTPTGMAVGFSLPAARPV